MPELHAQLSAYADAYQAAYGSAETVADLIPYMLAAFIDGDSGFRKARRGSEAAPDGDSGLASRSRREAAATISAPPPIIPKENV